MPTDNNQSTLTIRILGRDYSVACPPEERESLLRSAEHLSRRMNAIQRKGKTLGIERIAVMAALNVARDLLAAERRLERHESGNPASDAEIDDRLSQLQLRIESALDDHS